MFSHDESICWLVLCTSALLPLLLKFAQFPPLILLLSLRAVRGHLDLLLLPLPVPLLLGLPFLVLDQVEHHSVCVGGADMVRPSLLSARQFGHRKMINCSQLGDNNLTRDNVTSNEVNYNIVIWNVNIYYKQRRSLSPSDVCVNKTSFTNVICCAETLALLSRHDNTNHSGQVLTKMSVLRNLFVEYLCRFISYMRM